LVFVEGDIGKAMIVFADARSAARGVIGYNDTDMIATMKQIHDEKKQKFDDYWAIVANTCVTGTLPILIACANADTILATITIRKIILMAESLAARESPSFTFASSKSAVRL